MKQYQKGFTLIEMMIVVVVLAILATIAYPSYQKYIRDTRLESARADLLHNAQLMERYYAQHARYPTDKDNIALQQNKYFSISLETPNNKNQCTNNSPENCGFMLKASYKDEYKSKEDGDLSIILTESGTLVCEGPSNNLKCSSR
ncbi:type IV pilin protein [Neisseria sp. S1]|uniref:type IV pilin protein n=1 Tax=Neisseria sp. S1 TaxID=3318354 RepID=UPI003A851D84